MGLDPATDPTRLLVALLSTTMTGEVFCGTVSWDEDALQPRLKDQVASSRALPAVMGMSWWCPE